MEIVKVEKRNETLKVNALRRAGYMPCCIYGGDLPETINLQMTQKEANLLGSRRHEGSTLRLELDGQLYPVQIKQKVYNYGTGDVQHMAFEMLKAGHRVNSVAHILLENRDSVPGVVTQSLFEVPFSSLPKDLVDTVTIDLSGKTVGTDIFLRDLPELCSGKLELKVPEDTLVLRIHDKSRAPEEEEATAEA